MFISDELAYIQMQKTGCTHIAHLLSKIFSGVNVGKHNAADKQTITSGRYFLSSIRNPWDWYLSLWTYGVQGGGALHENLTSRDLISSLSLMPRHPRSAVQLFARGLSKPAGRFRKVYDDASNVCSFREWLKLVSDPHYSRWLGEGYSRTALPEFCGFMSFRYLVLCCEDAESLQDRSVYRDYESVKQFEAAKCYISDFIRQESLEDDLCAALNKIRKLSDEEVRIIYQKERTNSSSRPLSIVDYYTEELIDLVGRRDRLIIEKFGYEPPA